MRFINRLMLLLGPDDAPAGDSGLEGQGDRPALNPAPSFRERKAAELVEEHGGAEPEVPRPAEARERTPSPELESAGIEPTNGYPSEEEGPDDGLFEQADPDGNPGDEEFEGEDGNPTNWQERFEDTQQKLSEVTANRTEMEQEHVEVMTSHVALKHELQDTLTEAKRFAEAYVGGFNQQIANLEHQFQNGMIEPENLPRARQQHQMFINQRNNVVGQIDEIKQQEATAEESERGRQAEVARIRLSRSIPGWSREKHQELGNYAATRGFSNEEFFKNLDYRFLEILHDSMQLNSAGDAVKGVRRQRKANGPKRNAQQQTRSENGQFRKAQDDFRGNPNQRGRFADMKARELVKEGRRR